MQLAISLYADSHLKGVRVDYELALAKGTIFTGLVGLYDKYISLEYSKIDFSSSSSFDKIAVLTLTAQKLTIYQSQISVLLGGTVETMYGLFNKVYGHLWVGDVNVTTRATFQK